jgi:predicted  nucleic acid-binding Zn-ribbon protein
MSSFQEVVDLNGELRAQVKEVSADNDELREVNNANEKKNAEILYIVESLTKSLNDERSMHEREINETKNIMEMEKANNAVTIQKLKAEMSTEKESSDANISNLVKSLDEAMVYRRDVSCKSLQIQKMMEEMKKSTTQATEDVFGAICQLEKDIDEEFQVTTQLKNGTEKLIMKLGEDNNSHCVDEVEDLLGNVRMIQCYQLSHFQMMNELATKNRGQIRSMQLLHTTIIEGVTNMQ